jgi:glyoxylase-like metal-dependent hydrolase (beta-lactamase superfamily II)
MRKVLDYSIQKVAPGVFLVRGRNKGKFPSSCSMVIDSGRTALIDAGCGEEALAMIAGKWNLDFVILSHGHPDHCSGAHLFPAELLWCPRESIGTTGNLRAMSTRYVSPELREEWIVFVKKEMGFKDFTVANTFEDLHRFDLGGYLLEAFRCPGHTEDHYCFRLIGTGIVFSIDIDLTSFGPWYANEESDIEKFKQSIRLLKNSRPDCVISSHMGIIRQGIEEKFDRFLHAFDQREKRIIASLGIPRSMDELLDQALIYRKYPNRRRLLRGWETTMVKKHLDRLVRLGLVGQKNGKYLKI